LKLSKTDGDSTQILYFGVIEAHTPSVFTAILLQ
jgi:hypothetical protein